jgi:hypothetical protein
MVPPFSASYFLWPTFLVPLRNVSAGIILRHNRVAGYGALATKTNLEEYRDMLVTARYSIRKLRDEDPRRLQTARRHHPIRQL